MGIKKSIVHIRSGWILFGHVRLVGVVREKESAISTSQFFSAAFPTVSHRSADSSMSDSPRRTYYELLQVSRTASPAEIKASYRQLLLSHHPDKSDVPKENPTRTDIDIGSLKEAFTTLFSPESRIRYDSELSSRRDPCSSRSRPAHIVSLEDFEDLGQVWTHGCRCGGQYTIEEADMEKDMHLVACSSCSEVIWVGYEGSQ